MPRQLTMDQLITIERLHRQQYYLNGRVRRTPRSIVENHRLGIPEEHQRWWYQQDVYAGSRLKSLLDRLKSRPQQPLDPDRITSPILKDIVLRTQNKGT
jgi:hypothetical protein